ncbi:type I polyketide synthase [Streptomyces albus]|uniref:type I polyketide synthase n=1 Tax=Streptomyces sp. NRRL F-5917 TaxID=1463873 RepID=UPI0004BFAB79|nr:type I polyketide synthase [Streptomyces sp. NRRL F-5917]
MSAQELPSTEERLRHFVKQLTAELRATRQRLAERETRRAEPVAVVGMSCRLPGGVSSPQQLWRLVRNGTDAISPFPTDRGWDTEALYDPSGERPGTAYTCEGGFLHDAGAFDAAFFGISPREALGMDPQQRLLLEASWEALEDAGLLPGRLRGSRTGVWVGGATQGYGFDVSSGGVGVEGYGITGVSTSVLSGRIAYTLGLEGPAVTVDTACSSSLVALHLACRSLQRGETDMALVGGVAVMATPSTFVEFSRQGGLAGDGRCKAFSADADGTGWAEGVTCLVVERLRDARRAGHRVLAVVRGSAVNQDGASNGLSAPNGPAQQRVIMEALTDAGLAPHEVDVVEAHGTGTRLGDPIEAQAVLAAYGADRAGGEPLWLGALKSNIGHTQSASGTAGVIKMVEALRHGTMPRTLHADTPSPEVDWSAGTVRLLTEARPWPRTGRPRRAGVSAFGIGGTNAHVILEEAGPEPSPSPGAAAAPPLPLPLLLSGASPDAVRGQAAALRAHMREHPGLAVTDVARSLVTTRTSFGHRAVVPAAEGEQLDAALACVHPVAAGDGRVGALFSGQGAQRPGMGRELAAAFPQFARALEECAAVVDPLLGRSVTEVMWQEPAEVLERTEYAQPALFAFEVALARLWEAWGVRFAAVAGHSVGEVAAAVVAGVLTLQDAARLVVARGRLMQALPEGGAMVAVAAGEAEMSVLLQGEAEVSLAAVNGPDAVVVSGARDPVLRVAGHWRERGRRTRRLRVSHAFHSPLMEPMLADFAEAVAGMTFRPPTVPVSPSAGTEEPFGSPGYWVEHARGTVRFGDAVGKLSDADVLVEIGPDAALTPLVGDGRPVLASVRRGRPEVRCVLEALGGVHAHGTPVDWSALPGEDARVPLPTYAFQRDTYWLTPGSVATAREPDEEARFWAAVEEGDTRRLTGPLGAPAELVPVLPQLARWHRTVRDRLRTDAWRYRVVWRAVARPATAARVPGTWLVVLPHGNGARTAARLRMLARTLADVVTVHTGDDRAAAATALAAAVEGVPSPAGVISLLDSPEELLVLVQALGAARIGARLWCVTQGAVGVGPGEAPTDLDAAAVWGLGRVAGLEHPDRWGGLVDVPAAPDERVGELLAGLLTGDGREDQAAVRAGGVWLRRVAAAPAGPAVREWAPRGTVLVTGGTGSLGAAVARWLAGRGPCSLVLVSRRGPAAPGAAALVAELEETGAEVRVVAADAADGARMGALVAGLAEAGTPVRAVFHAAGTGQNATLEEMGVADFRTVADGKLAGARVLDRLFDGPELDAFVLFSSVSGVWGSGRHGAYAAANAALDALAEQRRARGRPATSVAWGVWAGSGMLGPEGERQLRRRGLVPMPVADGIGMLQQVLDRDEAPLAVADIDWEAFLVGYTAARPRPLVEELPQIAALRQERTRPAYGPAGPGTGTGGRTVAELTGPEREEALAELVRGTVADTLGHADTAPVTDDRPFVELGLDSVSAVAIRDRLARSTGLTLPATLVFDEPTVPRVCAFLGKALDDGGRGTKGTAGGGEGWAADGDTAAGADDRPFAAVYRAVALSGRMKEVEALLTGAAGVRSRFSDPAEADTGSVRLASGPDRPAVIAFPPFAPVEQSLQFARLALFFRERRDLSMVQVPGFTPGSALADTVGTLVEVVAEQTLRCAGGAPFAVLGYSSSGWLAQAVTTRLEERGERPAGVVLLDTYLPDSMPLSLRQAMNYEVNERRARFTTMNFTTLTALGTYRALFRSWTPVPTRAPTLFVAPEDRIPGDPAAPPVTDAWRARWPLPHTRVTVPGDHCTIVAEHADGTAAAVHDWLAGLRDGAS